MSDTNTSTTQPIRNIAIIAHVNHGKTTLVDQLLRQSGTFRANQQVNERVMDSNDLERERGITILAKNCAVEYKGTRINIVDTPGHADFGGEVERALSMVDGVLLLVDAMDGPMPQTRFVTRKALALGLRPIVVVNKIDRPGARPHWVVDQTFDLFDRLGATEEQLDFPVIYASALAGYAVNEVEEAEAAAAAENPSMAPLFDAILSRVPARADDPDGPLQFQISALDYFSYVGRIGIGRINRGTLRGGESVLLMHGDEKAPVTVKVNQVLRFRGLEREVVPFAQAGDIVAINGIEDIDIGSTLCKIGNPDPLPLLRIDEPTLTMEFLVNTSPLAGREGKYVTSRQIRERLERELQANVALRVEFTEDADTFVVSGRGQLHLTILLENIRREGYELQVGQPQVIYKEIDGQRCEPIEELTINVPEEFASKMIDMVTRRKGEMTSMETQGERVNIEFDVPSRGIIGLRTNVLTASQGEAIMAHRFKEYQPFKGEITRRTNGSMIAMETGTAFAYSIDKLQDRGKFFIDPGEEVYYGQIVGEHVHDNDLVINVTKSKQLTNVRASGSDDKARVIPKVIMSLEEALEYIKGDEFVEVTPKSMRIRKMTLDHNERKRLNKE